MVPCSKCSLVGVECLAGRMTPFEACMCVRVFFNRVKIAVAVQLGVSI